MAQFNIDPNSAAPLYYQIRENLRELIRSGELASNEPIPSERELSEFYGVNRLTVRQAVTELVFSGLLRRQHGVGTFVAEQKITQEMPDLTGFTERMIRAGHKPGNKVLSLTRQVPTRSTAQLLNIALDSEVVKIVRLRLLDDEPFMMETCYLPSPLVPGLLIDHLETEQSLYHLLTAHYGIQIIEADEVLEPVLMTNYEANILQTKEGGPALLVEGVVYTAGHQPIEFTKSLVRGDKARFYFRLHHVGKNDPNP